MKTPDSRISIQQEDFDLAEEYQALRNRLGAQIGAIVCFSGLVRDRNPVAGDGCSVSTLRLEHYPGMTEQSILHIASAAEQRWPLLDWRIIHRIGDLTPSDQIVLVLVASAHREAAFGAAEFMMDYLKTRAVLWKKERSELGERWLDSTQADHERAEEWGTTSGD